MKKSLSLLAGAAMSLVVATGYADTINEGERKIIFSGQVSGSDLRLMLQRADCKKNTGELIDTQENMLKESSVDNYSKLQKSAQSHLMKSYKWCRAYFSSLSELNKRKLDDANKQLLEKVIKAWGSFKYMGLSLEETLVILSSSKQLISQFSNPPQELLNKVSKLSTDEFSFDYRGFWPNCRTQYDVQSMFYYITDYPDDVKKFINDIDSNPDKKKKLSEIVDKIKNAHETKDATGLHTLDLSLVNPAYAYRAYKKLIDIFEEHGIDHESDDYHKTIDFLLSQKIRFGKCQAEWQEYKVEQVYLPLVVYLRNANSGYFHSLLKQYFRSSYSEILNQSAEFKLEDYEKEREHGEEVMYDSSDYKRVLITEIAQLGVKIGHLFQQAIDARVGMGFGGLGDEDNPQYRWTITYNRDGAPLFLGGVSPGW